MKSTRISSGPVWDAAGVRGFYGEGYKHHKYLEWFGLNTTGISFVAKTTTLEKNQGNMPLEKDGITSKEFAPDCILPNLKLRNLPVSARMAWHGIMLNAVALSGPGAEALYKDGRWQEREEPFQISFMPIGKTPKERIAETKGFVEVSKKHLPGFKTKPGFQLNCSCPNVGLDPDELVYEACEEVDAMAELCCSLGVKLNIFASVRAAKEICQNPDCDFLVISNTIKFGLLPEMINWKKFFGTDVSPLARFGGGGLSGPPVLPLVVDWLKKAREAGIRKPINAGNGIQRISDVDLVFNAGASSISLGTVRNLRPWRVQGIVHQAYQLF
jgi:dihydroorotate dehydrogenase